MRVNKQLKCAQKTVQNMGFIFLLKGGNVVDATDKCQPYIVKKASCSCSGEMNKIINISLATNIQLTKVLGPQLLNWGIYNRSTGIF